MDNQRFSALLHNALQKPVYRQYQHPDRSKTSLSEGYQTWIMTAGCQQTSKQLAADTQCYRGHTSCASSDYIRYSTQNDNITATLPRFYFTMDG